MARKITEDYNPATIAKEWRLRLYVTDRAPRCVYAYQNLKRICAAYLQDQCQIEVVDIKKNPEIARQEQIVAIPTLVRLTPKPARILIGDFSNEERVIKSLDLEAKA